MGAPRGNCNRAKNKARCFSMKGKSVSSGAKAHLSTLGEIHRRNRSRLAKSLDYLHRKQRKKR